MRVLLLLCVFEALLLSGCQKKTSPEFYKLESQQSVLVSRDGDDAYASDEMAAIITALQAIPDETIESPRATELATRLAAEQARVKAERELAARPKPAPVNPFADREPTSATPTPVPEDEPSADQPDAGPAPRAQPWAGMDEKTFVERFGQCFKTKGTSVVEGKPATSYTLSSSAECQKQFGEKEGQLSYLFTSKGLWGKETETSSLVDAGVVLVPGAPAPPPPPRGPDIITIPGAPQPEGYEKTTP